MIINNFHQEPLALDTIQHRDLRLDNTVTAMPKLAAFTSFLIAFSEFAECARDFPILFVAASPEDGKESVAPVAVFGMKPGENLFLKGDLWDASYVPAIIRAYPFTMARIEGSDRWAVVFDNAWKGINRETGQALFDDKGEATPYLAELHRFTQQIENDIERTRQGCRVLMDMKLLKPMRFEAQLTNGENITVDGFLTLDEEAMLKLSDTQLAGLYRNGMMHVLLTHHLSLGNMRRLIDRRAAANAN